MLDPAQTIPLDLSDFDSYLNSCLDLARERLADYPDLAAVADDEDQLNKYPRLEKLTAPRDILVLDREDLEAHQMAAARRALLKGEVLLEHTCAGEATRLGLGTKYLITPSRDLTPPVMERLLEGRQSQIDPGQLRPLSLGRRHMLQMAWDLSRLAQEEDQSPQEVLQRQHLLIIVNQASAQQIIEDFQQARFYGFAPGNLLFMVQEAFHGINLDHGRWFYDTNTPKRLHNHGQMLMQTTMEGQLFRLDQDGSRQSLSWPDYQAVLGGMADKISFNIEDLDYLELSLDLEGLAVALTLGERDAAMVMEVVANNPEAPQKGGSCAWDPELGRNVMVESFQLAGLPNERITHLNKNINHYPSPLRAVSAAHQQGLSMPLAVKKGFLYFQPVQGDLNFLVPTAFWRRARLKPISAWKGGAQTEAALKAMAAQEGRPGFLDWARGLTGLDL